MILAVTLWHVDSAAALKYHSYELEPSLAGHLDKGSIHWMGSWYMDVWDCVQAVVSVLAGVGILRGCQCQHQHGST